MSIKNKSYVRTVFFCCIIIFGLLARYIMFPMISRDQKNFLEPWFDYIKQNGGFWSLKNDIGDYMPTYFYIMIIINALPVTRKIYALKFVSVMADVFLAYFVMKIVIKITGSREKGDLAFGTAFFLPSVMIDSASWGQCDSIFTLFLVMCVYYIINEKDWKAVVCISIAFVFKLQAIFLAPLILLLVIKGRIKLKSLSAFPIVYIISIIPAIAAGHDILSLFTVYIRQSGQYSSLNMTLPNAWSMFADVKSIHLGKAGVFFAGGTVIILLYWLYIRNCKFTEEIIVVLSALVTLFVPYVLPYMHERYYYTAVVMCLIATFLNKKLIPVFLTVEFASVTSMCGFLLYKTPLDLRVTALFVLVSIIMLMKYYYNISIKIKG